MKVNITDKAIIDNETKRGRDSKDDSNFENFFGKPKVPMFVVTPDSSTSTAAAPQLEAACVFVG